MTAPVFRIGTGYDAHRLVEGRPLVLGGVRIEYDRGLEGHSDADVVAHALTDALLGAAALGDIGTLFPDTDDAFRDADSIGLLKIVIKRIADLGWEVSNVDVTVLAEKPVIAPFIDEMVLNVENTGIGKGRVNIKATRGEGMGFIGRQEGIAALAVALLVRA